MRDQILALSQTRCRYRHRAGTHNQTRMDVLSGLGYGAVCLSMGLYPALWTVLVLWFIWGMFYGPEEVIGQVLFADAIDKHMRGRVYSFMGVVFSLAGMVGYLITGWAVPAFGAITAGGSLFTIATVFTFILGPTARTIRTQERQDEPKSRGGQICSVFCIVSRYHPPPLIHHAAGNPDNIASR